MTARDFSEKKRREIINVRKSPSWVGSGNRAYAHGLKSPGFDSSRAHT